MINSDVIRIADDSPQTWDDYAKSVCDFVPDPMMLRAVDLFLMGRSRCNPKVWESLFENVFDILGFFDALVTRERIPFINYWETFSIFQIENLLGDLSVRVSVEGQKYLDFHKNALARLEDLEITRLSDLEAQEIDKELAVFEYMWQPDLGSLKIPDSHRGVAQFILGGLIFGAYATASGTDHLLQNKRSRMFLALSAPKDEQASWRQEQEQRLFEKLRDACLTSNHVRFDEYPAAPSIVPYLMREGRRPETPRELLEKALEFRDSSEGKAYRNWYVGLRKARSWGQTDQNAVNAVERVRLELEKRYGDANLKTTIAHCDVNFDVKPGGIGGGVTFKDVKIGIPEWVRRWLVDNIELKRQSKVMLRVAADQQNFPGLVFGLKKLWDLS